MVNVELPEAASLQRTEAVMRKIDAILKTEPALRYASGIAGFSILSQTTAAATHCTSASSQPYQSAHDPALQSAPVVASVNQKLAACSTRARSLFCLPPFPASARPAGVDFFIQDHAGKSVDYLWGNTQKFLAAARKRPELARMNLTFSPAVPQLFANVDNDKVFKLGVSIERRVPRAADFARRLLRQPVQSLRPRVEGLRRGGAASTEARGRTWASFTYATSKARWSRCRRWSGCSRLRSRIHHPL